MDDVQKYNIYNNIPSSQAFRSYIREFFVLMMDSVMRWIDAVLLSNLVSDLLEA
jgi:phage-related holin